MSAPSNDEANGQIDPLEATLKLWEQAQKVKEHELEVQKFEFEQRKWQHEQDNAWHARVQQATDAAYDHRHQVVDKALWLYLGSLSERSGSGRPTSINQVLDEFWSVYGTLQSLIVKAPFEGPPVHLQHEPVEPPGNPEEHF